MWIGLSREQNKDWSWINGDQPNISHWKYEPNQYDTSQKCASVALKSPYWWYEGFCHEAKPFICQFREGKLPWRYRLFFILIKIDIFKVLLITLSFFHTQIFADIRRKLHRWLYLTTNSFWLTPPFQNVTMFVIRQLKSRAAHLNIMQKIRSAKSVTSINGQKVNIFYKRYQAGIIITENAILVNTVWKSISYFLLFGV